MKKYIFSLPGFNFCPEEFLDHHVGKLWGIQLLNKKTSKQTKKIQIKKV